MTKRNSPFTGWNVFDGMTIIAVIPFSASFKINGVQYMASTDAEAERLGRLIIANAETAEADFYKNHTELNP